MQFKIITPAEAGKIRAEATVLFESTLSKAHVCFAEHSGRDVTIISPRGGRDVFVVGNADHDDPDGHGFNMHKFIRDLAAQVNDEAAPEPAPELDDVDPFATIVVEG